MLPIIYTLYQKHILEVAFGFGDLHQLLDSPFHQTMLVLATKTWPVPETLRFWYKIY